MARQRLMIGEHGELRDRDGNLVGTIHSITVDLVGGKGGNEVDLPTAVAPSADVQESLLPQGGAGGSDDTTRVWAHYQATVPGGERYQIDAKRRSIIRNALKVRPMDRVLLAIDGLAVSPHHNGHNDRRKKYLGINYALQGIGAESNDERIDKMADLAGPSATGADQSIPSAAREMVRTRQRLVEDMLLNPGDADRAARAGDSERYLRETWGLTAQLVQEMGGAKRVVWSRTA